MSYNFDAKFEGNILMVGKIGCGKNICTKSWEK